MATKIILMCGPSASGKDTLASKLVETNPDRYHKCVLATSRPPRAQERHGIDYYYFKDSFIVKVSSAFLFPIDYNGWIYAIPKDEIIEGKTNLIVSNSYWAEKFLDGNPLEDWDIKAIYLDIPSKERLIRSLMREENPDCKEICRRFLADEDDWNHFLYNYSDKVIITSDCGNAIEKIIKL